MCGLAGIIGHANDRNRAALKRMNDAMTHRGPDAEGLWESSRNDGGWCVMLAHRRLSILDLSSAGAQPMVDPISGHAVVLNGEIYNYVELRRTLSVAGRQLDSTGDTAVMLRLLSERGNKAVGQLRGMFAFAFWDPTSRRLTLARDPLGIKPLYLARNPDADGDWSLAFASEVRALLASGLLGTPRLNPLATASVVWNGFMVTPETAIAGIESVWPGQLRVFDGFGREELVDHYWDMPRQGSIGPADEVEVGNALAESVRLHLASDVPLGVFLSGGVDSAAVANLAQKAAREAVHTFTLAFEEEEYNEGHIARRISEAIGTRHQEVVLTERHFIEHLDAALDSLDQPTFDGINSYFMSHAVRQAGFKVALVGTGGDELFGGYTSFRDLPPIRQWAKRMNWLPEGIWRGAAKLAAAALQPATGGMPQQTRWAKLPAMVDRRNDLLSLYQMAYSLFLPDFQQQLFAQTPQLLLKDGLPLSMYAHIAREATDRSSLAAISVMEQRIFLGERLLRDTDAASMSASIEIRLPLVDQSLLESVYRLPDQERFKPIRRKAMLRRIGLRGLDPALFERPKSGFVLPYDKWLRSGVCKVMDEAMRDPDAVKPTGLNPDAVRQLWRGFLDGAPGIYWSRVWAIYVLIRWCQRHNVGTT
jgi:asparagine synthase (glutamine-hydrolysing)